MSQPVLPVEVDTVIVGAGAGGAAFAATLLANSAERVLLLEAGPDYGRRDDGNWPADVLSAKAIPLSHDWGLSTDGTSGPFRDLPRARVIGGCTSHNGCTASIGAREDYDDWTRRGNDGWSAQTVEPLLEWTRDRFRVRRYTMEELTSAQAAFVRAGVRSGLPFADDLDDIEAAVGIGPMPVNIVDGVRWNAAFAFLDDVRDAGNLTIVGDCLVGRVLLDGMRAVGVEARVADGDAQVVRASRVVISGGAYHSPALLQRSGIGNPHHLRTVDVEPVLDLPGVGRHLLDHACVQLDFHGKDGLLDDLARTAWNPDEQTVGRARSSRCDAGPYDIHVFMVAGANSGHPGLPPISLYGGAMRAVSEGQVLIRTADPDTEPAIDHRYGTDTGGHDRAVFADSLELLHTMTADPELSAVLGAPANTDRDPLTDIASYCHPAGTCAMGPASDHTAVVDATGSVHGIEGLYVADASIMPAIVRGNINLPTAMIGARIAARLLGLEPAEITRRAAALR